MLDSDRYCKVFVTDIVQKLVFQDKERKVIYETDGSLVSKIIEVSVLDYECSINQNHYFFAGYSRLR